MFRARLVFKNRFLTGKHRRFGMTNKLRSQIVISSFEKIAAE